MPIIKSPAAVSAKLYTNFISLYLLRNNKNVLQMILTEINGHVDVAILVIVIALVVVAAADAS